MVYLKGIEEELFIGSRDGIGKEFCTAVQKNVSGFVYELDERFTEYATEPCERYEEIRRQMLGARRRLRAYLSSQGGYSVIPGGALPLDPEDKICAVKVDSRYYAYLLNAFGAKAAAAGTHLNLGVEDVELLMRLYRVIKMEAPLYLALTAASPFLGGRATGLRSTRWFRFPQEPFPVPFFSDHQHYIQWTEKQLRSGRMLNVRHLWTAVRPNGKRRPYDLDRLEVRICDSNPDPNVTLAALALLESRAVDLANRPEVDVLGFSAEELRKNEEAVCRSGLDAEIYRWDLNRPCRVRDWIEDLYENALRLPIDPSLREALRPIETILDHGNAADQWLEMLHRGMSLEEIVVDCMTAMERLEASVDAYQGGSSHVA